MKIREKKIENYERDIGQNELLEEEIKSIISKIKVKQAYLEEKLEETSIEKKPIKTKKIEDQNKLKSYRSQGDKGGLLRLKRRSESTRDLNKEKKKGLERKSSKQMIDELNKLQNRDIGSLKIPKFQFENLHIDTDFIKHLSTKRSNFFQNYTQY